MRHDVRSDALATKVAAQVRRRAERLFADRELLCSEAVLVAVNEAFQGGLDRDRAVGLAAGLPEGMGSGCLCGALGGASLAAGLILGRENAMAARREIRQAAQAIHVAFQSEHGATCCRALRKKVRGRRAHLAQCTALTGMGAELAALTILERRPGFAAAPVPKATPPSSGWSRVRSGFPAALALVFLFLAVLIALLLGTGSTASPVFTDTAVQEETAGQTDAETRQRVREMYAEYKADDFPEVLDIEPRSVMNLAGNTDLVLVDVRSKEEQTVSMLPGAITEQAFLADTAAHAGRLVVVYCTISYRSGVLARRLAAKGIRVLNLRGGVLAWAHAGGKLIGPHGPTRRVHVYDEDWNLLPRGYEAVW